MESQKVKVQRRDKVSSSWISDWYKRQEQLKRLVEAYENHEMHPERINYLA